MPERKQQLQHWPQSVLKSDNFTFAPASSDASFRRYFRVQFQDTTQIAMDAPPNKENSQPFIDIAELLLNIDVQAPKVIQHDLTQGFLLLSDLGNTQYLDVLNNDNVNNYYSDAINTIIKFQNTISPETTLPAYDEELLLFEMSLFKDWFLADQLAIELHENQLSILEETFKKLANSALEQPIVFVHRDYHSRNLMVREHNNPGVLDFQDAVFGPVTYDLVSLLRDCYITWPEQQIKTWAIDFYRQQYSAGKIDCSETTFLRWFDWMGIQRHLKAIGIFSRLNKRDSKPGYLGDIPRTLNYIIDVAANYDELKPLSTLLHELKLSERVRGFLQ